MIPAEAGQGYLYAPLYAPSKAQLEADRAQARLAAAWDEGHSAGAYDQHHLEAANSAQEKPRNATLNPYRNTL